MKLQDLFYKFMLEYDSELSAARKDEDFKRPFAYAVDIYECLADPT